MILAKANYTKGRKFRVVRDGAEIRGFIPDQRGTRRCRFFQLEVGTVLTCLGPCRTADDSGPAICWADEEGHAYCLEAEFFPKAGGPWSGTPEDGYLIPLD